MNVHALIAPAELEKRLTTWAAEDAPELFVVEATARNGTDGRLRVSLAVDSMTGVSLSDCEALHRALRARLNELGVPPEDAAIHVASPGLGAPFRLPQQYRRHLGRPVRIETHEGARYEGRLETWDEAAGLQLRILARNPDTRKIEERLMTLTPADVKRACAITEFDLPHPLRRIHTAPAQ